MQIRGTGETFWVISLSSWRLAGRITAHWCLWIFPRGRDLFVIVFSHSFNTSHVKVFSSECAVALAFMGWSCSHGRLWRMGIIHFLICIFTFFKTNLLVSVCFCLYIILISPRLTKYLVSRIRICVGAVANLCYALGLNRVNTGLSLVRTTVEM